MIRVNWSEQHALKVVNFAGMMVRVKSVRFDLQNREENELCRQVDVNNVKSISLFVLANYEICPQNASGYFE